MSLDPFMAVMREWIGVVMNRSMQNIIHFSKERGLSMAQLGVMFRIMHRGSSGVSDLGDEMGVSSAAASQMLERLVQQGLILRSEDPHDRRVKNIVLTDKGNLILKESLHARQVWLDDLVDTLSEAEKEQIIPALKILVAKANQL